MSAAKPPYEPRFSDPLDERIFAIVKDALDNWQIDATKLPIKELQDRVFKNPDIAPESLDRKYVESLQGGMILETSNDGATTAAAIGQNIIQVTFATVPAMFLGQAWPLTSFTSWFHQGSIVDAGTKTGNIAFSSGAVQTVEYNWICIRPRS